MPRTLWLNISLPYSFIAAALAVFGSGSMMFACEHARDSVRRCMRRPAASRTWRVARLSVIRSSALTLSTQQRRSKREKRKNVLVLIQCIAGSGFTDFSCPRDLRNHFLDFPRKPNNSFVPSYDEDDSGVVHGKLNSQHLYKSTPQIRVTGTVPGMNRGDGPQGRSIRPHQTTDDTVNERGRQQEAGGRKAPSSTLLFFFRSSQPASPFFHAQRK